jgi:carbamoyltransferase
MGSELDYLVVPNCILDKKKRNSNLKKDYTKKFKLD